MDQKQPEFAKPQTPGFRKGPTITFASVFAFFGLVGAFGGVSLATEIGSTDEEDRPSAQRAQDSLDEADDDTDDDDAVTDDGDGQDDLRDPDFSDPGDDDDPDESDSDDSTSDPDRDSDQQQEDTTSEDDGYITEDVVHTVKWGDTLADISGEYGVPMEIIAEHNGITDYNVIYEGSALLIPYSEVNVPLDWDQ